MMRFRLAAPMAYIVLFALFFTAIRFYFFDIQTRTIYGDDLTQYQELAGTNKLSDAIDAGKSCYKFRPVSGIVSSLEIHQFQKTLGDYYNFNVVIQALIATLFAAIVNIFL